MTITSAPIVVATDLSPAAGTALAVADSVCRRNDAPLVVSHVIPDESTRLSPMFPHEHKPLADRSEIEAAEDAVREQVSAATGRDPDDYTVRLDRGVASEAIATLATELAASLIVVAVSNKGAIARAVIGSTTEQLAEIAKTPLLVVRHGPEGGVVVVPVDPGHEDAPHAQLARAEADASGAGLFVVTDTDPVTAALDRGASLIVVDGTSENDDPADIVRRAECSVLIYREG